MTDTERIARLEMEVEDLRAKMDFILRQSGFHEDDLVNFRKNTTMPAPPLVEDDEDDTPPP